MTNLEKDRLIKIAKKAGGPVLAVGAFLGAVACGQNAQPTAIEVAKAAQKTPTPISVPRFGELVIDAPTPAFGELIIDEVIVSAQIPQLTEPSYINYGMGLTSDINQLLTRFRTPGTLQYASLKRDGYNPESVQAVANKTVAFKDLPKLADNVGNSLRDALVLCASGVISSVFRQGDGIQDFTARYTSDHSKVRRLDGLYPDDEPMWVLSVKKSSPLSDAFRRFSALMLSFNALAMADGEQVVVVSQVCDNKGVCKPVTKTIPAPVAPRATFTPIPTVPVTILQETPTSTNTPSQPGPTNTPENTLTNTPVPPPTDTPRPGDTPTNTPVVIPTSTNTPNFVTATPFPPQGPTSVPTSTPGRVVPPTSTPFNTVTPFPTETVIPGSTSTPRPTATRPALAPTATAFRPQPPTSVPTSTAEATRIPPTSTRAATVTPHPTETRIPNSTATPPNTPTRAVSSAGATATPVRPASGTTPFAPSKG